MRRRITVPFLIFFLTLISTIVIRATGAPGTAAAPMTNAERLARGEYLVTFGMCNDCHTPLTLTQGGAEPDMARMLSGHPSDLVMPTPPLIPAGPWVWIGAGTNTAFAGPWGVSFTANLTPDPETGLGRWTEEMFITALRTGKHEGKGRPILPPMPYPWISKLTDEDLGAVFAYLQSIPPVRNKVPAPIDPVEEQGQ